MVTSKSSWFSLTVCICTLFVSSGVAAEPTPAQLQHFENKIRPILANSCYKCHSQQAEKLKGGLLLDSRDGLLKGGTTGPAIIPFQPDRSLLIQAVRYTNEDLQMPPKGEKLSDAQVADLIEWVTNLELTHPGAPARAPALVDKAKPAVTIRAMRRLIR